MELTEEKLFEAFGVSQRAQAEREQGGSDPAAGEDQQQAAQDTQAGQEPGQEEQGGAEDQEDNQGTQTGEQAGQQPAQGQKDKPAQTPEERRENAARRRRQEQQAAIDRAVAQARQEEQQAAERRQQDFFAKAGLKNSFTGAPITNMEEFEAWKTAFDEARIQKELQAGKLTRESVDAMIAANPTVRRAEEIIRQSQEQAKAQAQRQAQERIDGELAEIHKLDPSINGVEDLLHMPNAKAFYDLVKKGNTFLDAFRLANFEQLAAAQADAARQQAMTNARGKDHLRGTGTQQGEGAPSIPPEEMEMFRRFNPKATEDQIRAYYQKTKKKE